MALAPDGLREQTDERPPAGGEQPGEGSPHLEGQEKAKAEEHAPLRGKLIHEIINEEGKAELERSVGALFWSGLAAGLSMGFSFLIQAMIRSGLPHADWAHLVASFGYTLGFLIVILGRQQLFTESTLTAVLPVLTNRDGETMAKCLKLWAVVLLANLLGTILFAAVIAYADLFKPEVLPSLDALAREPFSGSFLQTFGRAVIAGWLIALMVWLLPSAGSARPIIIVILAYAVALGHLTHIIASSSEAAFGVFRGAASWGDYLLVFLLPTLLGNTVGGVALVALLNHAPVKEELEEASSS